MRSICNAYGFCMFGAAVSCWMPTGMLAQYLINIYYFGADEKHKSYARRNVTLRSEGKCVRPATSNTLWAYNLVNNLDRSVD